MEEKQVRNGREVYLDVLKAWAIIGVVLIHISVERMQSDLSGLSAYTFIYACSRFSVPIFFMVTGIFLTKPTSDVSIRKLYGNRILRILFAAFVYGVIYKLLRLYIGGERMGLIDFIKSYICDFARANLEFHFWYVYALIAIYISAPILKEFLNNAKRKKIEYFIIIWIICNVLYLCGKEGFIVTPYNMFDGYNFLGMFVSYTGFVVLGYYLYHFGLPLKLLRMIDGCGTIIVLLAIYATIYDMEHFGVARIEYLSYYSPAIIFLSISVFEHAKKRRFNQESLVTRLMLHLGSHTMPVYFIHFVMIIICFQWNMPQLTIYPVVDIAIYLLIVLIPSWLYAALIGKIPVIKRLL